MKKGGLLEPKLYKPKDVQAMLQCSRGWLYSAMRRGEIPVVALSPRCLRIPADALEQYLKERSKDPASW